VGYRRFHTVRPDDTKRSSSDVSSANLNKTSACKTKTSGYIRLQPSNKIVLQEEQAESMMISASPPMGKSACSSSRKALT
jgi:hypothetical protein